MESYFSIWLDNNLSPRARERILSTIWPISQSGDLQVRLQSFDYADLRLDLIANSGEHVLAFFSDSVSDSMIEPYPHLAKIESFADCCKLVEGCYARKMLGFMERNALDFAKTCKPDFTECVPGVLGGPCPSSDD
jgi:hypothetical protein